VLLLLLAVAQLTRGFRTPLTEVKRRHLSFVHSPKHSDDDSSVGSESSGRGGAPRSSREEYSDQLGRWGRAAGVALGTAAVANLGRPRAASAIGELYEFKDRSMVLQDVCFNVADAQVEVAMLSALFVNTCKTVREQKSKDELVAVAAFGPEYYKSPPAFIPGVSDYSQDGGHATISFRVKQTDENADLVEIVQKGDGLQFVKIGAPQIRLSKAIEKGADIKKAYGWVDVDTPAGVPFQVVVGIARDPIMMASIRVTSVPKSQAFFTKQLGMQVLPFPLARAVGSAFEAPPPKGAVYVGYGPDSMGLLLVPNERKPVNVGSQLQAFTIVVDNKQFGPVGLPPLAKLLLKDKLLGMENEAKGAEYEGTRVQQVDAESVMAYSPDGYPFLLKTLDSFQRTASRDPLPYEAPAPFNPVTD